MHERTKSEPNPVKAGRLQRVADALSLSRAVAGPCLALYLARSKDYRKFSTAAAIGIVAATDYLDGKVAGMAKEQRPNKEKSERGAWLDQMADKAFVHGIVGGMAVHAAKHGDRALAGTLVANQAVQLARDVWVTRVRADAQEHGVPTGARWLGRVKTATTLVALTAKTLPPLPHYETAQTWTAAAGITTGTALSIASGMSLVSSLHTQIETTLTEEVT